MVALSRVENQKLEQEHALHGGYYMAGGDTKFLFEGSRIFHLFAKFCISSGRLMFYLLQNAKEIPNHYTLI